MDAPRWSLDNVFPGIDSPELARAIAELERRILGMERFLRRSVETARATDPGLAGVVGQLVRKMNDVGTREVTIRAYVGFLHPDRQL